MTSLFTDIEGSIPLWEQHPEAIKPSLVRHDIILHKAIPENRGQLFKLINDAFEAAFTTPAQALAATLADESKLGAAINEIASQDPTYSTRRVTHQL